MKTLEELKKTWEGNQHMLSGSQVYDQTSLEKIVKSRVKKETARSIHYFWASFTLQVIVYALLSHVIVKYWFDGEILIYSFAGVLLFLPFTIMLLKKFKSVAKTRLVDNTGASLHQYVLSHDALLRSFYHFKKRYEYMLTPLSSAIGVFLTFKLYVPGGVSSHPVGAAITFIVTLLSCVMAIRSENSKSFEQPLQNLQMILNEFTDEVL